MKHPPVIPHLEQATLQPPDAWAEFFALCRELAQVARQRRAAPQAQAAEEADARAPEPPAAAA